MSEDFYGNGSNNENNNLNGERYPQQENAYNQYDMNAYNQQNANDYNQNAYNQNAYNQQNVNGFNQSNQNVYNQNTYDQQKPSSPLATASMVCGIISAVLICLCTYLSIPLGIVAIALGVSAKNKGEEKTGFATAGIVCGICGAVISLLWIIIAFAWVGSGMWIEDILF